MSNEFTRLSNFYEFLRSNSPESTGILIKLSKNSLINQFSQMLRQPNNSCAWWCVYAYTTGLLFLYHNLTFKRREKKPHHWWTLLKRIYKILWNSTQCFFYIFLAWPTTPHWDFYTWLYTLRYTQKPLHMDQSVQLWNVNVFFALSCIFFKNKYFSLGFFFSVLTLVSNSLFL